MASGIAIKDVDNKLQSLGGEEVIPISTGANEPEVVEVDTLKEYINADIDTALEGKQDVISDLSAIRSGAALGATALQSYTESDPTVHEWAKAEQKPSYTASEVGALPDNTQLFSGDYNDLDNKPTIPSAVTESTVSGWGFTKNTGTYSKPSGGIPSTDLSSTVQTSLGKADTALQSYTETDPTVPSWAKAASKPSYTAAEVGALPDTTVIPTESTVSGWGFTKNAGTITGITMNGASKGTSGVVDLGTVITEHQSLTNYVQKSQTSGLLKNDGTVDTTAYTTNTGTVTSTGGTVAVSNIQVVSALPASPDANTLYLIPES